MTFQAYLDTVKAKTGKTPADFKILAEKKGLVTYPQINAWLKSEFGLGHGHANAVAHVILEADKPKVSSDEQIDKLFSGNKTNWRESYDGLIEKMRGFGDDVAIAPTNTYISILRSGKKFAIVQVSGKRLDIGIKRPGTPSEGRFEEAGAWNAMVTHRVRIEDPKQIDAELITWLRQAYDKA